MNNHNTLLNQALRFENENPIYSQVTFFCDKVKKYQLENNIRFMTCQSRQRATIVSQKEFFQFLSSMIAYQIDSFTDIKNYLKKEEDKASLQEKTKSTKHHYIDIFNKTILYKNSNDFTKDEAKLFRNTLKIDNDLVVAIENSETFFEVDSIARFFPTPHFIYLGGFPNSATQIFLEDKRVICFLDFDIFGMEIFLSLKVKQKSFFKPENIEELFRQYGDTNLYLKQVANLKESDKYKEILWLYDLIKGCNCCLEQELVGKKLESH